MTLNELLEDITSYVNQYKDYEYKTFKSNEDRHQDDEYMEEINILLHEELSTYLGVVTEAIENLQKLSVRENYYFFDCAFKVYENHYEKRKEEYLEDHIDVNEADFIKQELTSRMEPRMNRKLKWGRGTYFYDQFIHSDNKLYNSELKKREFLVYKLELLGWDAYLMDDEDGVPSYYRFEKNNKYVNPFESFIEVKKDNFSNSQDLYNYIGQAIKSLKKYEDTVGENIAFRKDIPLKPWESLNDFSDILKEEEEYEKELILRQKKIQELLKELYYKSAEEDFYWFDCPSVVYKNTLESRYKKYTVKFLDGNLEDFLNDELDSLINYYNNRNLDFNSDKLSYDKYIIDSDKLFYQSKNKKIDFIKKQLENKNDMLANFKGLDIKEKTKVVPKFKDLKVQIKGGENVVNNIVSPLKGSIPKFDEKIFKSLEAEKWFFNSLKELNAVDSNQKVLRGFQAKANAIFSVSKVKEEIFIYSLTLRDYISFLNRRLEAKIATDKKLSSGINHERKVDKLIENFSSE